MQNCTGSSYRNCLAECRLTNGCSAVACRETDSICVFYGGGPYTQGDGQDGVVCYPLQGNLLFFFKYFTNAHIFTSVRKNISLNSQKRNALLTARKYHFHVPINNCMKHVPRRRLVANFFVPASDVILFYDVQFCNTNTPTYPIILYHKQKIEGSCMST